MHLGHDCVGIHLQRPSVVAAGRIDTLIRRSKHAQQRMRLGPSGIGARGRLQAPKRRSELLLLDVPSRELNEVVVAIRFYSAASKH
jgi:hypothetical protein